MKKTYNKTSIIKTIFYILLLFSFFEPGFLEYCYPSISTIYTAFRYISFIIITFLILSSKSFSRIIIHITVYLLVLFVSSIINSLSTIEALNICVRLLTICLVTDYGIRKDTKNFLNAICIVLNILIIYNFITLMLYPQGMYTNSTGYTKNWVLGYKNTHILYIIPAIILNYVRKNYNKEKLSIFDYIIILISLVSTLIVNNSTGIVGIILLLGIILFPNIYNNTKIFNSKNYFVSYISLYIGIVVMRLQNIFKFLIVDMLHKDLTFTGRIYIWDKVIEAIKAKPILGYGNSMYQYSINTFTTHNTLLDVVYKTGIIGLIIYILLLIRAVKQLYIYRKTTISKILSIGLLIYFIMMITEAYSMIYYLYIIVICTNIKYLLGSDNHE